MAGYNVKRVLKPQTNLIGSEPEHKKKGTVPFWRRRFGADVLAPTFWRRDVLAPTFWRRDVLVPVLFGARPFWRMTV